jgi:hypothetical protein
MRCLPFFILVNSRKKNVFWDVSFARVGSSHPFFASPHLCCVCRRDERRTHKNCQILPCRTHIVIGCHNSKDTAHLITKFLFPATSSEYADDGARIARYIAVLTWRYSLMNRGDIVTFRGWFDFSSGEISRQNHWNVTWLNCPFRSSPPYSNSSELIKYHPRHLKSMV